MEEAYRNSLLKSFNKTLDNGFFPMVIIDAVNEKVRTNWLEIKMYVNCMI